MHNKKHLCSRSQLETIFTNIAASGNLSHNPVRYMCVCPVISVLSDSERPCGLQPAKVLYPWDSPGKNTGVGCQCPYSGDLVDPGIEPASLLRLLCWQMGSLPLVPPGKPPDKVYDTIIVYI